MGMSLSLGLSLTARRGGGGVAWAPVNLASLYAASQPGDIFVADMQYLYQDRAATTPVTAVGQPVRAIRGAVNNILAAVLTDGQNHIYAEVDGVGYVEGLTTSRPFYIARADLTGNQLLGTPADDHGFYIAGKGLNLAPNVTSEVGRVNAMTTSTGWASVHVTYYLKSGGGGLYGGYFYPDDGAGGYVTREFSPLNYEDQIGASPAIAEARVMFARTGGFYYADVDVTRQDTTKPFSWYLGSGTFGSPITTPLAGNAPADIDAGNGSTTDQVTIFANTSSSSSVAGVRHRYSMLLGDSVDPDDHERLLNTLDLLDAVPISFFSLFSDGTPGDFFVAHPSRMFRDFAGTVPVTAAGQQIVSVRGAINNTLAVVASSTNHYLYDQVSGIDYLTGQSGGSSRGFRISTDDLTHQQVYGTRGNDHGFLVAGAAYNIDSFYDATFSYSADGTGYISITRYGGGALDGTTLNTQANDVPAGLWDYGVLYAHPVDAATYPVTAQARLIFGRNSTDGYGIKIETSSDPSGAYWEVDRITYTDASYTEVKTTLPLPDYDFTHDPPADPSVAVYNITNPNIYVFGHPTKGQERGVRFRSVLLLGKGVAQSEYDDILAKVSGPSWV